MCLIVQTLRSSQSSWGSEFQSFGVAAEKAQSPRLGDVLCI